MSHEHEDRIPVQDSDAGPNPDIEYTRKDGSTVKVDFDPLEWVLVTFLLIVLVAVFTSVGLI